MELSGKVAVVTGGGRGLGKAIAMRLAEEGAKVMIGDIIPGTARETASLVAAQGFAASGVEMDVRKGADAALLVDETLRQFGAVDILINNAGQHRRTPFLEFSEADWDDVVDVNLKGCFLVGQAAARAMVKGGKGGKIVNMCSVASKVAIANQVSYLASKGGLHLLTRGMAMELAPYGINVNAVGPGTIKTEMTKFRFDDPVQEAWLMERMFIGRAGEPSDVAEAVLFLVSPRSSFITGHLLMVDGGWTIH